MILSYWAKRWHQYAEYALYVLYYVAIFQAPSLCLHKLSQVKGNMGKLASCLPSVRNHWEHWQCSQAITPNSTTTLEAVQQRCLFYRK